MGQGEIGRIPNVYFCDYGYSYKKVSKNIPQPADAHFGSLER